MKLFLASKVSTPETIERLTNFVGGFSGKKIVYVPTAANGEYYGSWKGGQSVRVAAQLGAEMEVVELESGYYTDVLAKIRNADILWIAGGMSGYLLYWMRRVELDKELPELLSKGMVYVGSSAGSMVCAKTQYSGEWYIGEPEPGSGQIPGLGLVDFEIYPHYREEAREQIEEKWDPKDGKLYLLKDGDAITVVDGKVEVLGEEIIIG